jgi:uncharacterized protein (DUF2062 family)
VPATILDFSVKSKKGVVWVRIVEKLAKFDLAEWLRLGMTPRRLALTLALGFAIGCIPVIGVPTILCAALALLLGLNQPAIQAANYAAMPLQLILIVPFMRLGKWMFPFGSAHSHAYGWVTQFAVLRPLAEAGWLASLALFGWMLVAIPAVLVLWFPLTLMLQRIPAIASAESGD